VNRDKQTRKLFSCLIGFVLMTGCATSSTSEFDLDEWSNQILDCIGTLESQYPNADRAGMWVVCEDEFWSDKQDLLRNLCSNDPNFASCEFRK
jgi:hypothetical protein